LLILWVFFNVFTAVCPDRLVIIILIATTSSFHIHFNI
jgi:hypothetical protein